MKKWLAILISVLFFVIGTGIIFPLTLLCYSLFGDNNVTLSIMCGLGSIWGFFIGVKTSDVYDYLIEK